MNRIREGKLVVARLRSPHNKIIVGTAILVDDSEDLVAIKTNKNGQTQNVRLTEAYDINALIDYYEGGNRQNQPNQKRQPRKGEVHKESELLVVALLDEAKKYHPELRLFIQAMPPEALRKGKALLQTMIEKGIWVDYGALRYKAKQIPERHKK